LGGLLQKSLLQKGRFLIAAGFRAGVPVFGAVHVAGDPRQSPNLLPGSMTKRWLAAYEFNDPITSCFVEGERRPNGTPTRCYDSDIGYGRRTRGNPRQGLDGYA
jgi:hypothetical protein